MSDMKRLQAFWILALTIVIAAYGQALLARGVVARLVAAG
jgi:hypothetical protein